MNKAEMMDATTSSLIDWLGQSSPAEFKERFGRDMVERSGPAPIATAEDYHALFSSALGQKVLQDMVERFAFRSHYVPGNSRADDAVFGEGVRAALVDIMHMIGRGSKGD